MIVFTKRPKVGPDPLRLARFNLRAQTGEPSTHFVGLPIPAAAGMVAAAVYASAGNPIDWWPELIEKVKLEGFATETVGMYTLGDIREELRKPGRDPREKFVAAKWRDDVQEIADLKPGMVLEGVVTNVTRFGAFVDVGVHQDGLVHMSELANRYVKDASEVVKVGQIVKVQVLSTDPKAKRIALSMKALDAAVAEPKRKKPSLNQQVAALQNKFRVK